MDGEWGEGKKRYGVMKEKERRFGGEVRRAVRRREAPSLDRGGEEEIALIAKPALVLC